MALILAVPLVACDPTACAFVPCDGEGYGVWVTNNAPAEVFVRFGGADEPTYEVPAGTIDGRGPFTNLLNDGDASAKVMLWDADCNLIDDLPLQPGEYRLVVDEQLEVSLMSDDVLNDAGDALLVARAACG